MAVEETGSLMGVDIQSAADDVLEKWMEVVCSVAEMGPLLRLSAYRSGCFMKVSNGDAISHRHVWFS